MKTFEDLVQAMLNRNERLRAFKTLFTDLCDSLITQLQSSTKMPNEHIATYIPNTKKHHNGLGQCIYFKNDQYHLDMAIKLGAVHQEINLTSVKDDNSLELYITLINDNRKFEYNIGQEDLSEYDYAAEIEFIMDSLVRQYDIDTF